MKTTLLFALLLLSIFSFAQQQPEIWYFGTNAGLDFSSGSPVAISGSAMSQWEGVAVACDTAGNLKFYTDGLSVYNSNNQVMPNGSGLLGNPSSTQSATVLPMPGDSEKYYLFTCTDVYSNFGFRYSIVDMTLNSGLGDVTSTKNVLLQDSTTEQCVVIPASDGCVWVLARQFNPVWYAYKVDTAGIQPPVISNAGSVFVQANANGVGYLKASPLNNKIAIANYGFSYNGSFFEIYDFNDTTGEISNAFQLNVNTSVYGCSFSPSGKLFYAPEWGPNIYQFDLTAGSVTDIQNSKTNVGNAGGFNSVGDLQIGPDQKIYCAINGGYYLGVINNPDTLGSGCDFEADGVYLGGASSGIGLPATLFFGSCVNNTQQLAFAASDTGLCQKFCIDFTDNSTNNPTAWQWLFPGASPISSTDQNPTNVCYNLPGTYDVTLITTSTNGNDTLVLHDYITVHQTPAFPSISQNGYTLTSSAATTYQWQLNATDIPGATDQSYAVQQTGFYTVIVSDENGCRNSSSLYVQITGIGEVDDANLSIYPNPSSGNINVEWLNAGSGEEISIEIVNAIGQKVFSSKEKLSLTSWKKEIDLSGATPGVYVVMIRTSNDLVTRKIQMVK